MADPWLRQDASKQMGLSPAEPVARAALLALLSGCSSHALPSARDAADASDTGGTVAASSPDERTLLEHIASLPSGAPKQLGDTSVVAERPYDAASGRTCRAVELRSSHVGPTLHRLACAQGKSWVFVPDVFGQGAKTE